MSIRKQVFSTINTNKHYYNTPFLPKPQILISQTQKSKQNHLQVQNISINNQRLQQQLSIYHWRCKTQFPIVKISHFQVLQRKTNTTVLEIKKEKQSLKLKNCKQLPLFKVLYLLKQSVIGFQRLYNKFGPFMVTPGMITISISQKCKVWFNQNYFSNAFIPIKMKESSFLSQIYSLFQQKSNLLKNTCNFYHQLYCCQTFSQTLTLIQNFAKQKRIMVSSSCKLTTKEINQEETNQVFGFTSSLSINKNLDIQQVQGVRISLNTNTENPFKKMRKLTTGIYQRSDKTSFSDLSKNKKTDTQAEQSFFNSYSKNGGAQRKNVNLYLKKQQNKQTVYKSQLPIRSSPQQRKCLVRKCMSHALQIKQFERFAFKSQKSFDNLKTCMKTEPKINSYGNINDQEDEETTRHKIQNAFKKNHWNKRLNDLWQEQAGINHSIVNTQQKIKLNMAPTHFQLLGQISKNLYQSVINPENKPMQNFSLHASQF